MCLLFFAVHGFILFYGSNKVQMVLPFKGGKQRLNLQIVLIISIKSWESYKEFRSFFSPLNNTHCTQLASSAALEGRGQLKFTSGRWSPHHNCTQVATASDTTLRGWDTRSMRSVMDPHCGSLLLSLPLLILWRNWLKARGTGDTWVAVFILFLWELSSPQIKLVGPLQGALWCPLVFPVSEAA